jgi:hypothetical protein
MYEIEIKDEFGTTRNLINEDSLNVAKRIAKDGAKYHQGTAEICDRTDNAIVIEYKYEDGNVYGYDPEGNAISATENFGR